MKIINGANAPIKSWCLKPEAGAVNQALNLANLPFLFKHVCLMPDAHQGYGMPIGGVIALEGAVIPNAVGVDIGCGMLAVQTNLNSVPKYQLQTIVNKIKQNIPVGFKHRSQPADLPEPINCPVVSREYDKARRQLGTLGGGNHFIEVQKGSDGYIWFMIHSGSRNLGKQVAEYYNKAAVAQNEKNNAPVPKKWELAYLTQGTPLFENYINEMNYCLNFACLNRLMMSEIVQEIFAKESGAFALKQINIHHNYAAQEEHFNRTVWVHRKGATSAKKGETGIIPGSQGTKSYIVEGRGNSESFMSCSHGAGRKMGRKEAVRSLNYEAEKKLLEDKGIIHCVNSRADLEEASGAYKDINAVMREQEDLVNIIIGLEPLAVIKG